MKHWSKTICIRTVVLTFFNRMSRRSQFWEVRKVFYGTAQSVETGPMVTGRMSVWDVNIKCVIIVHRRRFNVKEYMNFRAQTDQCNKCILRVVPAVTSGFKARAASHKQRLTCTRRVAYSAADISLISIHVSVVIVRPGWIRSVIGQEGQESLLPLLIVSRTVGFIFAGVLAQRKGWEMAVEDN